MLANYERQVHNVYCRVSCRECLSACPNNVAVNDVLRYAMYFEHYGREKEAIGYYADLEPERKPLGCENCAAPCESACPYGLQVKAKLQHSHEILTA
jgi:predicted aldo/keto reductase-like oxidoreductase